jgi:pantothenate kinase
MIEQDVLAPLCARVDRLAARSDRRVLIGIAGAPGAGKTTLAEAVVTGLVGSPEWADSRAAHVPMDGFHLADVELERLGRADRKGAPDTFDAAGYAALLRRIRAGEAVWAPAFDRTIDQPVAQSLPVTARSRIVVSEGNYLLLDEPRWRPVRALFDEVWFVRTDEWRRVERLVARHVAFGKTPEAARAWVARSDEANAALVAASADAADLVVDF